MGDYDSIFGFAALGLDTFPVENPEEAAKKLRRLSEEYGIIYMTEELAGELRQDIEKFKEQITPAIILIPGISGNTGEGVASVRKAVEIAVGSDILFSD